RVYSSANPLTMNFTNLTVDNPAGSMENYTVLDLSDVLEALASYEIKWTAPSSLPPRSVSFAQKFINISILQGTPSIDSLTWHWLDSELGTTYNENKFKLWKYNATDGWTLLNDTPDTTGNTLRLFNHVPGSDYGIFENQNCPVIAYNGTYTQTFNYEGAPNPATPLSGPACVVISASNVTFDCNGYNITNNVTAGSTIGIFVNNSINVTVKNCPAVSGYSSDLYIYYSNSSLFQNITAYNASTGVISSYATNNTFRDITVRDTSLYGFYLLRSPGNNASDITVYNSTGVYVYLNSHDNLFTNLSLYNNSYGLRIALADNVNVSGAHIYRNGYDVNLTGSGSVNLTHVIIDNPAGDYQNYTNLSLVDTLSSSTGYTINWTINSTVLPVNRLSFAQKYVNISSFVGTISIDSITWHWLDAELGTTYNESRFELWKYNATFGWTLLNASPATTANTLSISNHNPGSDYALLQKNISLLNCPLIDEPGSYLQPVNYTGAPNTVPEDPEYIDYACIKIASSDVLFDC
ncbi:MAG: right-handed parallel beta-helix repeat-containing protein, partial [Candidatus Micrarchaeota archaeon]